MATMRTPHMVLQRFRSDWETESDPVAWDLCIMAPFFALLFPLVRFLLDRLVLEALGWKLVFKRPVHLFKKLNKAEQEEVKKLHVKFKESGWKLLYYLSAELFAVLITYQEPWFRDTKQFWVGPGSHVWPEQKAKLKLKVLYSFSSGFYVYSIFALLFWETRRKDFVVSMLHHISTLILIVFSFMARFSRVGSVVLALHDASDVFLEIGKMTKYAGIPVVPDISFAIFAVSWVILRLIYFPFWIIRSTSYEVLKVLDIKKHAGYGPIMYYVFNTLLISLFVLHVYWWILIFRMLVNQIKARGKIGDDVRSDEDDD